MKHAISISLGSSARNKKVTVTLGNEKIVLERIGTDGDEKKATNLFTEFDGKVDALGVGGVELYIQLGQKDYPLRSGLNLVKQVKQTPVVDGRGLKHTLERQVMQYVASELGRLPSPSKAFMPLGVDRYGMAQSLNEAGYKTLFGDILFALSLPIPVYGLKNLYRLGRLLLPIVGQLPISMVYPTGENQEVIIPKYESWFAYGSVIAGDFLYIRKHLPENLHDKMIVTNTTTAADVALLQARNLRYLVTTTPIFEGRSFGTNMLEAALTAYASKNRPLSISELNTLLQDLNIHPDIQTLS